MTLIRFSPSSLREGRWYEYLIRFALGGAVTVFTGLIGSRYGPSVGGLFLALPAIFCASATLIEKHEIRRKRAAGFAGERRGQGAAALDAAGAALGALGMQFDREKAEADPLIAIAGGGGVNLFNSQGNPWTADYLKITGELDVDLRSNIAAEARAKIVYERLINFCDDAGSKDALQFLMTREITHMKAFAAALESMKKPVFTIGKIAPTPGLVNQFFNDSTGVGDEGEIDTRGPWNEGGDWEFMTSPALSSAASGPDAVIKTESSPPTAPEACTTC